VHAVVCEVVSGPRLGAASMAVTTNATTMTARLSRNLKRWRGTTRR
jgi:hypothetical protein